MKNEKMKNEKCPDSYRDEECSIKIDLKNTINERFSTLFFSNSINKNLIHGW